MILSVANQKGGVAKTTSTLAIASNLKKKGYKALVIDMDPQGNLSESVNANQIEVPTVYELLKQEVTADEAIQKLDFFDIIPSNIMLAGAEQELSFTGKEYRLKESLENITEEIIKAVNSGVEVAVLVGGGNIFRGRTAEDWEIERAERREARKAHM